MLNSRALGGMNPSGLQFIVQNVPFFTTAPSTQTLSIVEGITVLSDVGCISSYTASQVVIAGGVTFSVNTILFTPKATPTTITFHYSNFPLTKLSTLSSLVIVCYTWF